MMQIRVNIENLISLISNLLIRLRKENLNSTNGLGDDIAKFIEYLGKYSNSNDEVLFDNNFITSLEEKNKLNNIITMNLGEIDIFKKNVKELIENPDNFENLEYVKEYLRKIAASLILLKDN